MNRCILRTDGTETPITVEQAANWKELKLLCNCELFDIVRLPKGWVMLVDDEGLVHGEKALNPKATMLYRSACRPGFQDGIIAGDVALVQDGDFE